MVRNMHMPNDLTLSYFLQILFLELKHNRSPLVFLTLRGVAALLNLQFPTLMRAFILLLYIFTNYV